LGYGRSGQGRRSRAARSRFLDLDVAISKEGADDTGDAKSLFSASRESPSPLARAAMTFTSCAQTHFVRGEAPFRQGTVIGSGKLPLRKSIV
jgi:hypothetical protein